MAKLSEMVEIANPKQPHCATVLLLDISGSMDGSKLKQLNDGLRSFKDDICGTDDHPGDELAKKRVDLAMVTFSSDVKVIQDFTNMDAFEPPTLQAGGTTAMGEGIRKAIELIERRKSEYKAQGTDYYRPWILLITDGEPTDIEPGQSDWNAVVQLVRDGEAAKKFVFFSVGVEPANLDILKQIARRSDRPS